MANRYEGDIFAPVADMLEGELKNWPPIIQDKVYKAIEAKEIEMKLKLRVLRSYCKYNDDDGKYWCHVVVVDVPLIISLH